VKRRYEGEALIDQIAQSLAQVKGRDRIKPVERLVEDHMIVTACERCGDGQSLSHARRAVTNPPVEQWRQA
jgi:hypothetical protein